MIAFTFDDGPSYYRPQTLAAFRAQGVPATFFNLAVRMQANPQIDRFTLTEGHKILLHSYEHPRLTNLSANGLRFQVEGAAALFTANGAPLTHKVLRAPFGGTNAAVNEAVAGMGYAMDGSGAAGTADYDPVRTAAQIRDAMVAALRPGPRAGPARRADRHARGPGHRRRDPDDRRRGPGARLLLRHARRDRPRRRRPLHRHRAADPADRQPGPLHPARVRGDAAVAVLRRPAAAADRGRATAPPSSCAAGPARSR